MVCKYNSYNLGDEDASDDYKRYGVSVEQDMAMYFYVKHIEGRHEEHPDGMLTERGQSAVWHWIKKNVIRLPLYLYDHSGITMKTTPFMCPWDSGQVGFIYATKEDIRKNFQCKKVTKKLLEQTEEILRGEVETYYHYITGEVYGFNVDGIDSCGGYFGEVGIQDAIAEAKSNIDYHVAQKYKEHAPKIKDWIRNKVPITKRYQMRFA